MTLRRLVAIACCVWTLALSPAALADDVEVAAETFKAGELAFQRGDFVPAAKAFEASYRLAPHGMAAFNAAVAWRHAEDLPRAADAFARSLSTAGLTDERKQSADEQLKDLRTSLGWVTVDVPKGSKVSVAHLKARSGPLVVHLPPGAHTLVIVQPDGQESRQSVELTAGQHRTVTLKPPPPPPPPLPPPLPAPVTDASGTSPLLLVGGVLLGVGVVSGGAAVALGVLGLSARDDFAASGMTDQGARDEAIDMRTGTNIAWAAAGVFAVTGTVLLVVSLTGDASSDEPTATQSATQPGLRHKDVSAPMPSAELYMTPNGLGLRGRF